MQLPAVLRNGLLSQQVPPSSVLLQVGAILTPATEQEENSYARSYA